MRLAFLCIFSLFFTIHTFGQNRLSGKVIDASNGAPISDVNVFITPQNQGFSTNAKGQFSFSLNADTVFFLASSIGYKTFSTTFYLHSDTNFMVALLINTELLKAAEISAKAIDTSPLGNSVLRLSAKQIENIPALFGEPDVIKSLQLLPGVQGGNEGTTGLHIRGGSPDQNLILLDGVPVYNVSHLFGFFSTINAKVVEDVTLLKGAFPAKYGGRLSSVLEIRLREGDLQNYHGEVTASVLAPKFMLEGPIKKGQSSFLVSGRRSFYDLVVSPFIDASNRVNYYFGDFNLKLKQNISEKDVLLASYFFSGDKFRYQYDSEEFYAEENALGWQNHTTALTWKHQFNNKLSSNLTTSFNAYRLNTVSNQSDSAYTYGLEYESAIRDISASYAFAYQANNKHLVEFGSSYALHKFTPGAIQSIYTVNEQTSASSSNLSLPIASKEASFYVSDQWKLSSRWQVNAGFHYALYDVENTVYQSLQPRMALKFKVKSNWDIYASYSKMTQFLHLLSNTGFGLPTDLWVTATDKVKPQEAQQISVGSSIHFLNNTWEFTNEYYFKPMENLIEYKAGAGYTSGGDWQQQVETNGTGLAYGAEFLLRKNKGKTTGWVSYTLARTERTFENLNNGNSFPYRFDRRHNIASTVNHTFSSIFSMSATWVYSTGIALTAPVANIFALGYYDILQNGGYAIPAQQLGDRNAHRYPAYHRLDVSAKFTKNVKLGLQTWSFGIYNVYNRNNPFYIDLKEDRSGNLKVTSVSLFPILPSISYTLNFL